MLKDLAEQGKLPIRLYVMIRYANNEILAEKLPQYRIIGAGNEHLTVRSIKRQIDGALGSHGAWLLEPYIDLRTTEMIGRSPIDRAETRRLAQWFDEKFAREVTNNLVTEKVLKRFLGMGEPNSQAIRAGHSNVHYHLDYLGWLAERRRWLAGDDFSLADVAAAAHLSAVDYLGDVPWSAHEPAKEWYQRVKSRPSLRPLLGDYLPGAPPPKHYADLDF
jgi:glutathione S-transferase